jgi:hypothetical protein
VALPGILPAMSFETAVAPLNLETSFIFFPAAPFPLP